MSAVEVLAVLDALAAAGCPAWVAGGWGVDALVGRETRAHRDLDLAIEASAEPVALAALAALGYVVETDWRPIRVEVAAPGDRWVDLHPVVFDAAGNGTQAGPDGTSFTYPRDCFTSGTIGGRPVPCLSATQQLEFHRGYEPRPHDLADLALLRHLLGPPDVPGGGR
jgi:lincosamide nucleotidyltransferase A/C/D/E